MSAIETAKAALRYILDDEPTGIPRASSSTREVVREALAALDADAPKPAASEKEFPLVRLDSIVPGQMFRHGKTLALMSEYGDCEAYIVGSGEIFWGGTSKKADRRALMVEPVADAPKHGASVWQSSETAPKDGTEVLYYFPLIGIGRLGLEAHIRIDAWEELGSRKPTHWMPLPQPPTEKPE